MHTRKREKLQALSLDSFLSPPLSLLHPRHPAQPPSRQRPRHPHDDFPLAEAPKVHAHADDVVETRVGALIKEQGGEGAEGVDEEAGFDAAVHGGEGLC